MPHAAVTASIRAKRKNLCKSVARLAKQQRIKKREEEKSELSVSSVGEEDNSVRNKKTNLQPFLGWRDLLYKFICDVAKIYVAMNAMLKILNKVTKMITVLRT